jgi:hypothetical protein
MAPARRRDEGGDRGHRKHDDAGDAKQTRSHAAAPTSTLCASRAIATDATIPNTAPMAASRRPLAEHQMHHS